jgi:hypothetical protein
MPPSDANLEADETNVVKLVVAWLWVGIPAVWGIWHVFLTSLKLFR